MKEKRNTIIAWVFFALILTGVLLTYFLQASLPDGNGGEIGFAAYSAWGLIPI